jgi:hypothetical protein
MFRRLSNLRHSSFGFNGDVGSVAVVLCALAIPGAVAMRFLSLNQALFIALGFVYATMHRHLSSRVVLSLAFALTFFFLPVPSRFIFGVDLLPIISLALIIFTLNRDSALQDIPKSGKQQFASFYLVCAILFAGLATLTSIFNYRGPEFLSWAILPIASAVIAKFLQRSATLKFKDFMEFWTVGVALLMLLDVYGLVTSKYRSTDLFNLGRFTGSLGDYELSAEIYGLSIIVAIYVLLVTESKWLRAIALLEITGFVALLVATQTRSSFLLTLLGAILIISSSATSKRLKRSLGTLALVGASAQVVLLAGGSFQEIWNRLASTELNQDISGVANRSGVWGYFQNLRSFTNLPPIGNGFSYPYSEIQSYPHSLYLWILWSGGFFCLVILLTLVTSSVAGAVFRWKTFKVDASAALIILCYVLIDQAKVEVARFASSSWIFWLVLALTFSTFDNRGKASHTGEEKKN